MNARDLAALRQLAALKSRRALADLAKARRAAAEAAAVVAAAEAEAAATYGAVDSGAELEAAWTRREAMAALARSGRETEKGRRVAEDAAAGAARAACRRELGVEALARRATEARRIEEARRAERVAGVLAALRGPGEV